MLPVQLGVHGLNDGVPTCIDGQVIFQHDTVVMPTHEKRAVSSEDFSEQHRAVGGCAEDHLQSNAFIEQLYGWKTLTLTALGVVFVIVDLGSDIYAAFMFWTTGAVGYFIATLIFILLPTLLWSPLSFLCLKDSLAPSGKFAVVTWLLLLGPLRCWITSFVIGVKLLLLQKQLRDTTQRVQTVEEFADLYQKWREQEKKGNTMKLFECYLETAPQFLLQCCIVASDLLNGETQRYSGAWQVAKLAFSGFALLSISWAPVSLDRAKRFVPEALSFRLVVRFLVFVASGFFFLSSRFLVFVLFAVTFKHWVLLLLSVHVSIMFAWLVWQDVRRRRSGPWLLDTSCKTLSRETANNFVLALCYAFFFPSLQHSAALSLYVFFYGLCFLENVIMILVWFSAAIHDMRMSSWIPWFCLAYVLAAYMVTMVVAYIYRVRFHRKDPKHYCAHPEDIVCV